MAETKNIITVKNAEGDPDTTAEIIIQNKIDFEPKVSVIIPVYNVEEYLRECLDSVINQTLKEIEIICVDDGSTDSSLEILKEYAKKDNRFTVMKQENLHAGVARNAGLAVAKGEYLSFLDSDDFFELNMLEEMSKKADEDESDITVCNADIYNDKEKKYHQPDFMLKKRFSTLSCIYTDTFKNNLFNFTNPSLWNKIFRKKFILDHQLLFQSIWNCNDIGFTFSALAYSKKISIVYKTLLHYRRNTTTSITSKRSKGGANIIRAYKYVRNNLVANNQSEYLSLLIESFKEKIQYEKQHYTKAQLKLFKKEAKCLLGCDWPIFSQCFKQKHFHKKIIKILKAYLLFPYYLIKVKKLKKKTKRCYINYFSQHIRNNSVLLVEINSFHGECLPGAAKYFLDLGYNVDVILSKNEFELNPFSNFTDPKLKTYKIESTGVKVLMTSDLITKYEHIYFNSDRYHGESYYNYFTPKIQMPKGNVITMCHHPELWHENNFSNPKFKGVSLANLPILKDKDCKVLNAHYFTEITPHQKNKTTTFICVGNIESKRKNHSLLFDAVQELKQKGFFDFKIIVIARKGDFLIPENIKQHFDFKGRLNYQDMYNELQKADFFLPLFDPENEEHSRYLSSGTSGSFQLIYGFNIPCIMPEMFLTDFNGFTKSNTLTYPTHSNISSAMEKAILMDDNKYQETKKNLKTLSECIYSDSLNNLKAVLK